MTQINVVKEQQNLVSKELIGIICNIVGLEQDEIQVNTELLNMGFDSLLLLTFSKQIIIKYGVEIPLNIFFLELNTIEKITNYILDNIQYTLKVEESEEKETFIQDIKEQQTEYMEIEENNFSNISDLKAIFDKQFEIVNEQNIILKQMLNGWKKKHQIRESKVEVKKCLVNKKADYYVPYQKMDLEQSKLTELELSYIKDIEQRYIGRTKKSKDNIQHFRAVYANARNSAGFNRLYKEMLYQVIAVKAKGSKFLDLDGNEILDLTMGFGVNLFGYGPDFVKQVLIEELEKGMPLGPMGRLPGEVALQITELTGVERVFFCNSGTEANMFAVRIARAVSGRNKIVCFTGSYHGTYDGLLGLPTYYEDGTIGAIPMAPGIAPNVVKDLVLLSYDSEASLKYIEEHANEVAGVLVETVQSRRPELQPIEFLKSLRRITEEKDIALIFDEIITGFRICAGGSQEYFNIQADIVTFGKIIGGGMPIGIVSGKAKYLDSIDGGFWKFGDDSIPIYDDKKTFAAGTFCHHPMAMVAAHAVLAKIKENRDTMYVELNSKADYLIDTLNEFFDNEDIPFKGVHYGSLLRFHVDKKYEIFYYGIMAKGVYIWEGRNCFISTEHSKEDIDKIIEVVKETVLEMKDAGFFKQELKKSQNIVVDDESQENNEFPMSLIQQRLYSQILINEFDPFDIVGGFFVTDILDIQKVENIVNTIVKRHNILRTQMFMKNGEFKQKILQNLDVKVKELKYDFNVDMDTYITNVIKKFDLAEPPLIEVLVITMEMDRQMLLFHFHHIAADGISLGIFTKEFTKLYNNEKLNPISMQYKEYVEWEKKILTEDLLKKDEKFWIESLNNVSYKIPLPYDYVNQKVTYIGETLYDILNVDTVLKLKKIGKENNASLFIVLFSAFSLLFHKISCEDAIAVTTPVTNRHEGGFEDCIGMFTNTVALCSNYIKKGSFKEYLDATRNNCLGAYQHLNYPYNMLVNALNMPVDQLFNVMFVYENTDNRSLYLNGVELERYNYFSPIKEFEISVELLEKNGEIEIFWAYRTDLFKRETMKNMMERFKLIISQVLENIHIELENVETILASEKDLILNHWNCECCDYPREQTIVNLFEQQVKKTPYSVALTFQNEELTYKELNERSNQIAHRLRRLNVGREDYVAIVAERSLEMVCAIYGILKAGAAYVPLDSSHPMERIQYMIADCNAKVVLTYKTIVDVNVEIIDLNSSDLQKEEKGNLDIMNHSKDVAYCIYTSGTTGHPKGVMVEHSNVVRLFFNENFQYDFDHTDVWMMFHSYCFDFSVWEMYGATLFGGKLIILSKEEAKDSYAVMNIIKKQKVTVLNQVPSAFYNLLEVDDKENELSVRYLIFGGEALNPLRLKKWHEWHPKVKIINMYGITETTVHVTYREIGKEEIKRGISDIGRAIPTLSIYVMNGNTLCGIGIPGELCVAGAGVARGYLNRPDLTAEKFVQNKYGDGRIYRSGDLARWLPDGNLEYLGRMDDQVKIRGFRIELSEIESVLCDEDGIKDARVIVKKDNFGENVLLAYVVSDKKMELNNLKNAISTKIPEYMIPSYIMQIEKIPITKNGKLDKRALPEIETVTLEEEVLPKTEIQVCLFNIFKDILSINKLSIRDNFFDLGGHSLRATRAINKIEEATGIRLPIKYIFQYPTVESLSKVLDKNTKEKKALGIPKAENKEYYNMSSAQRRMYLIWQYDKKTTLYNMSRCYKFHGKIDVERLKRALTQLHKRHEALRTCFDETDNILIQRIKSEVHINVEVEENLENSEQELFDLFVQPFNLKEAPLFRTKLVNRGNESLLMFDLHHIIGDGMSIKIIIDDLVNFYEGNTVEPLNLQYKDYSEWANEKDFTKQREYWLQEFCDEIPVLDLPLDYPRQQMQSFIGDKVSILLDEELKNKIGKLAKRTETTEYMVLLSSVMVLLSKYSRQEDIIIGSPISGRVHYDTENIVGMFVNTLSLRGRPSGNKTYKEFLMEMKETCIKANENQEYPFEEFIEHLDIVRDVSRNPLFDVMFSLQNNDVTEMILDGKKASYMDDTKVMAKFDLTFNIFENVKEYVVELEFCTKLFKRQNITKMLEHYKMLLELFTRDMDRRLDQIELVTALDKIRIVKEFNTNKNTFPMDRCVLDYFEEQVKSYPDNIAIRSETRKITYAQFSKKVNKIAYALRKMGINPNDFVAILAERNIEVIISIYGILKAGGAYVPIDPQYPIERIKYMISDCKPKIILSSLASKDCKLGTDKSIVYIEDLINEEVDINTIDIINKPDDIAYVIYTSGTTGQAKGTLITHKNILSLVINCNYVELSEHTRVLQTGSISFDASTFEIHGPLLHGGELFLTSQEVLTRSHLLKTIIHKYKLNTVFITTVLFNQMIEQDQSTFDELDYLFFGGEQTTEKYVRQIQKRNSIKNFCNIYGPTETTTFALYYPINHVLEKTPIGKPITNRGAYILSDMNLCGIGVPGELCITGDGVSKGYLNKEELTKEKFINNPFGKGIMYRTGDLARWLDDGNIEYLGRIDEQVKIRGFRIELQEIEGAIRKNKEIKDVTVIAREDKSGDKAIFAYFVANSKIDIGDLRKTLADELPEYMIPANIIQLDQIPVNRNGKVNKEELPLLSKQRLREYVMPANEKEEKLCNAFSKILNIEKVGIQDSFLELGGDSIKAIRIVSQMREFGYELEFKDIMLKCTPEKIAPTLKKNEHQMYEQGEVVGKILNTPILDIFRELNLEQPNHFNQEIMIKIKPYSQETIEQVLKELVKHHDILRAVYRNGQLEILSTVENDGFKLLSYNLVGNESYKVELTKICNRIQRSIHLENGPLFLAALFDTVEGYFIMMCMHHLIVDGVSWRIILDDFETSLEQAERGENIKLPVKTASYIEWAAELEKYKYASEITKQKMYWTNICNNAMEQKNISNMPYTEQVEYEDYSIKFNEAETERLVYQSNHAFNTEVNDLFLTALALTIKKFIGQEKTIIVMEGHGRENIGKKFDVDRTVGWFTSIYPVCITGTDDITLSIIETKESIREIPQNGFGFGLLRKELPNVNWEICFNYLGHLDAEIRSKDSYEFDLGNSSSPFNRMIGELNMNGIILSNKLQFTINFNKNRYSYGVIHKFADTYKNNLLNIMNHCSNMKEAHKTKSDIASIEVGANEFKEIIDMF